MTDDDPPLRALRDAADPGLAPGAAERIACGAWDRAARLAAGRRPGFRVLRRVGSAAAAAVLVVGLVFALRGAEPAFAVEGDPVMVRKDGSWVESSVVRIDAVVQVPAGRRLLRWTDGGTLSPRPGSVFRFVRTDAAPSSIRVVFESGGGDVEGGAFVVGLRDDVVVERDPASATFCISVTLDATGGGARVEVDAGRALVQSIASSDRLLLGAAERAAVLPVLLHGQRSLRLTRLAQWSKDAGARIADGRFAVLDANFGPVGGITLVGDSSSGGFLAVEVPAAEIHEALSRVNRFARFSVNCDVRCEAAPPTRYVYEKDATRVEVLIDAAGRVTLNDGGPARTFVDVAAFRRELPEAAFLFGDSLDR